MTDVSKLIQQIDERIARTRERVRQQNQGLPDRAEQEKRLQRFEKARDQVRAIAKPRLEALAIRFKDELREVAPRIGQGRAAVTLDFKSADAVVTLTLSVVPDQAFQNVIVEYDLDVVPALMAYESHAEFRAPIDNVDPAALEAWLDLWIVKFVDLFVLIHETEAYGRSEYVTDPVVHVKFPKFAAAATLEHDGKTWYFIEWRYRDEFARSHGIATS